MSSPSGLARRQFDPHATGALAGVRVIDLSRLVAGNMLTKTLADHGAEVIKIEPLKGDSLRAWQVEGISTAWKTWCRNKKSVCLDLKSQAGRDLVRRLAAGASMFVESFRPGVLEAMDLAPETLLAVNPKLVIVRVSGWGQTGPYRHKPGFGTLIEGYSGFAAVNGFADREPVLPPMFLSDAYAGLYGAVAAMIALRSAEGAYGRGQVIDLSLLEPMLAVLEPQIANYRVTGRLKPRTGSRSTNTAPRNVYRTRDGGWVCLSSATQGMAEKLFRSLGKPELIEDPRFQTNSDRLRHAVELDRIVADFIGKRTTEENLDHFNKAGVTIGPIMDAAGLLADPYIAEREALVELPDDELGWMPMHGEVPRFSGAPGIFARPAPRLGEHNEEILLPEIGPEELARLTEAGVVRANRAEMPAAAREQR